MKLSEAVSTEFLRACIRNGLVLDTNAFLPAFTNIETDREERRIIKNIISYCTRKGGKIILTTHILAEITNLTINRPKKGIIDEDISRTIVVLKEALEHHAGKSQILQYPEFSRFGFTDISIVEACKATGCGVLTEDESLCAEIIKAGYLAMNFRVLASQSLILDLYTKA